MRRCLALLVLLVAGCYEPWQEIKREKVGAPYDKERRCEKFSFCYKSGGYNWSGEWESGGFGLHHDCPGKQNVTYQLWRVYYKRLDYKSKTSEAAYEFSNSDLEEVIHRTECK